MLSDSTSSSQRKRPASFFCRLEFIEVKGSLGPNTEFTDNFFITTDQSTIDKLLDWRYSDVIGTMEFGHFKRSPVVAYRQMPLVEAGHERQELIKSLVILDQFESTFWLHSDCCVGHETAFLAYAGNISSNFFGGIRTCADTTQKTLTVTADEIHQLIGLYTKMRRDAKNPTKVHTNINSNRMSRSLDYVSRAQRSVNPAEKIAFYCTSLESLFSTDTSELTHQIAERVAVIASQNAEARNGHYWFLKECYKTRSKFLHGSALKDSAALEVIKRVPILDDLVRRSICKVLTDETLFSAIAEDRSLDRFMIKRILGTTADKA